MATERTRRRLAVATLGVLACVLLPLPVAAQSPPSPTPSAVPASEPWWIPVAFAGHAVTAVHATTGTITATVSGIGAQQSHDRGATWQPAQPPPEPLSPPGWRVAGGRILRVDREGTTHVDPGSPQLAGSVHARLAAPASLPGVLVAVDRDGVAWRRDAQGHWARALLLLPQGIAAGPPRITALVAFDTAPLSNTVYMATAGYSVLISTDGGDDWIRAGPGLPDDVEALATDATTQAVYAGTADGLWVHHLRALPAPPAYPDAALRWRWLGIALVTLAGTAAAAACLVRAVR